MAVKTSATDAAANWATGFAGAATKYTAGVNAVTTAPGQLAAQQQAAYLAGVQNNVKIWASKVAAVDLATWKAAAAGTGAQRLATGATKGQPKMASFMQTFIPQLTSVVGSLPARGTFDQNMQRFTTYATQLHQMKGQF